MGYKKADMFPAADIKPGTYTNAQLDRKHDAREKAFNEKVIAGRDYNSDASSKSGNAITEGTNAVASKPSEASKTPPTSSSNAAWKPKR